MIDSPVVAGWIAHVAFRTLLFLGIARSELRWVGSGVFLALWIAGFVGARSFEAGGLFFVPYVAVLDIALVFAVVKGDVRVG